jgi:hypothetical protein
MSSIIFEGNTYTFGATVSANLGTGTTSYVFGGLSSGSTFGFILRAFNNFGFSNFVGPAISKTLQQILEVRDSINAFSWSWPQEASMYWGYDYTTGSDVNLFYDSSNLSATYWGFAGFTRTAYPELMPTGNTGWLVQSSGGYAFLIQNPAPTLELGNTYIVSWYQHTGSSSGLLYSMYGTEIGAGDQLSIQQLLPQVGSVISGSVGISLLGPTGGQTGWIRYAVQFYVTGSKSRAFTMPYRTTDINILRGYIIGGLQLEKVL